MCLKHSGSTVGNERITESRNIDSIPRSTEYKVAAKDFVFECCSECTWRCCWVLKFSFDLTSNSRYCFQLGTCEFCYFLVAGKHAFDESSVFHNFVGFSDEFKLFHYLEIRVKLDNHTRHTDAEVGGISSLNVLNTNECRSDCVGWGVKYCIAKTEFWCVFYLTHFCV